MSSTQKSTFGSAKRVLATAASAAMIFALLPAGFALATTDDVCPPPGETRESPYPDVDPNATHAHNIDCATQYGIVGGFADGTFRPGNDITRAQMATFIAGLIETALGEDLPAGGDAFTDDNGNVHESNINKLANAGVVQGTGGTNYSPAAGVRRSTMATFIANAIDYVDDEEVNGSLPPAATSDHFTDDNGNTHEDNINRLAEAGIVEGTAPLPTTYEPSLFVFRGQMSTFVMESAEYLDEQGLWAPTADEAPTSNQTYTVTPGEAAENTVSASGGNTGARQYSVSGLDNDQTYDVRLYPAENVTVGSGGFVTFRDADNNNLADTDEGNVAARIEVINGAAVTPTVHTQVSPVGGTITFSVDSENPDSIFPAVFLEAATTNNGTLDLNADDAPTESFGIGGQKTWIPAEASQGQLGANSTQAEDELITSVNKDLNRIITDEATYFYDANDTFFVYSAETTSCGDLGNQVTMAGFEAELSAGDELDGQSFYQSNEELSSRFCLEDIAPAAPGATIQAQRDTSAEFTVTGVQDGATVTVYCGPDNGDAFNRSTDVQRGQTTTDQNANVSGFQVIATGLSPSTSYDCFITQTVSGEESGPSGRQDVTTTAPADPPLITDARLITDAPIEGEVDTNDEWRLVFDEEMDTNTVNGALIDLNDPDGDTIRVRCNTGPVVPATDFITDAACALSDGASATVANDTLDITLLEEAEDRNAAGNAGQTGGSISYPLTINNIDNLRDLQGEEPDVANSPDRIVDAE